MREHREVLALLETIDVGKPISDSLNVDVRLSADDIQYYREPIDKSTSHHAKRRIPGPVDRTECATTTPTKTAVTVTCSLVMAASQRLALLAPSGPPPNRIPAPITNPKSYQLPLLRTS